MKIMIIGNGMREHAITSRLIEEGHTAVSFRTAPNAGLDALCQTSRLSRTFDCQEILSFARETNIDLLFPCAEDSLFSGICDLARANDLPCYGPDRLCARLEQDKSFARTIVGLDFPSLLLDQHPISDISDVDMYFNSGFILRRSDAHGPLSVFRFRQLTDDIRGEVSKLIGTYGALMGEQFVEGDDFSLYCFVSDRTISWGPVVRDYPFLLDGNLGLKTAGMGCSLPGDGLPRITEDDVLNCRACVSSVMRHVRALGGRYEGVLVAQFIKSGERLFFNEIDVRPGDCEFINVLKSLDTPLDALISGRDDPSFNSKSSVSICLVPPGYPGEHKDSTFEIPASIILGVDAFIGICVRDGLRYRTGWGRSLTVSASSTIYSEALSVAEQLASIIPGNLYYRRDIGRDVLCE